MYQQNQKLRDFENHREVFQNYSSCLFKIRLKLSRKSTIILCRSEIGGPWRSRINYLATIHDDISFISLQLPSLAGTMLVRNRLGGLGSI
uniref:Uncharacterized protein n=1 Tax=Pararge aegeria TaxID=116150 RepID=S4PSW3_9NEOP